VTEVRCAHCLSFKFNGISLKVAWFKMLAFESLLFFHKSLILVVDMRSPRGEGIEVLDTDLQTFD
jgi:hypothetical protein